MSTAYNILPASVGALYDELLDRLLLGGADPVAPRGTFVRKTVRGRSYVYLQLSAMGKRKQIYVGPESDSLSSLVERTERRWATVSEAAESSSRLVSMLRQGGAHGPAGASGRLLQALTDHQAFRAGAVLVGSHAFITFGAMLGVRWTSAFRTDDLDLAGDPRVSLAVTEAASIPQALASVVPPLVGIPGFDVREPSSSFASRGSEARLDLVTPLVGKPTENKVRLPSLGVHAHPLRFLDYLIEETIPGVVLQGPGLLVSVPSPARFALHKLLVAHERRVHETNRARKDRAQASALLTLLAADRPGDLEPAWSRLVAHGPGWRRRVRAQSALLDDEARSIIEGLANSSW